jgi:hypothetical protein
MWAGMGGSGMLLKRWESFRVSAPGYSQRSLQSESAAHAGASRLTGALSSVPVSSQRREAERMRPATRKRRPLALAVWLLARQQNNTVAHRSSPRRAGTSLSVGAWARPFVFGPSLLCCDLRNRCTTLECRSCKLHKTQSDAECQIYPST